ncbi:TransThyretin-Related family domain [Caenorhabditis elegans]|uniref:TransThyretin-Related family domain n=1 Tax=Caenorhabditis elegans TaxID=6239 RepID=Q19002_CAEEL|nr:TransThyretin-Related family domain [Caenorhabditis elegans]CCD68510.1 TransThyretin-Related family domain [Caenorhabditis elegans]|eukprot:NP_501417.2 Uncharacterized protein CELE_D2096.5 [Caenorhabditis elegans]
MARLHVSLLSVFIFLLFSSEVEALVTTFHFNGFLSCGLSTVDFFVQKLQVWEEDFKIDDLLGTTTNFERTETGLKYKIDVSDDDDGLFQYEYEIYYLIEHNCTPAGNKKKESKINVKSFPVINGHLWHQMDIDLSKY